MASGLAPSQCEMPLQSNTVSYWLGTNLESALHLISTNGFPILVEWHLYIESGLRYNSLYWIPLLCFSEPPLPVHREPPMVPPPVVNNTYIQLESATQSSDYDSHCSDSGIGNRVESMHCSTSFTVTTSAGSSSGSFASSSPMDTQSGMHMKEQNYPGSQRMSNSDSECSRGSSYKFKNHIKLRFSADEDTEKHSPEAISRDSRKQQTDCKPQIFNRDLPMGSVTVTNISAPLTPPNSASPASSVHAEPKGRPEQEMDNSNKVPGFALHPTGTFYIPVVISMSQIMPYLSFISASALSGICHPISIPVVFSGPTVVSQSSSSSPATPSTPTQMGHSVPLTQGNLQAHHLRTEQSLSWDHCRWCGDPNVHPKCCICLAWD